MYNQYSSWPGADGARRERSQNDGDHPYMMSYDSPCSVVESAEAGQGLGARGAAR